MNFINKEVKKCDLLAARYYKLAEGDRERAARDWYNQVTKVTKMIKATKFTRSDKGQKGLNYTTYTRVGTF